MHFQRALVLLLVVIASQSMATLYKKCSLPDNPANGNVITRRGIHNVLCRFDYLRIFKKLCLFSPGEKIWFKCDNGFNLIGAKDFTCQRNGNWQPQPFSRCVGRVQKCNRPNDPANGVVISRKKDQQLFNSHEKVWFKCDNGFDLVGAKDFVCQNDRNWNPQPFPKCVRREQNCNRPNNPANGDVISRKKDQQLFNVGEKVWFKCDNGFSLVGAKDFVCQRNGNWQPEPFPKCVDQTTPKQNTVVACEGDFSKFLRCPRGLKIKIVKGFYGREDRQTCHSHAIRTSHCFARKGLRKLKKLCENRNTCQLQPSNDVFGDPCHGTFKYIEVTYFCRKH